MGTIRFIWRAPLLILLGISALLALWSVRLLFFRAPLTRAAWRRKITQHASRIILFLLNMKLVVRGPVPEPPFFLVCNHVGYMDIFVLFSILDCIFVAKGDIKNWPMVNKLVQAADTVFINRALKRDIPRVISRINSAVDQGDGVVVFPEGTSTKGEGLLPFKAPLLEFPAATNIPAHYACLSYTTPDTCPPAHMAVCWWGDMTFAPHFLKLVTLKGSCATVQFGEKGIQSNDRKQLAAQLQDSVASIFTATFPH